MLVSGFSQEQVIGRSMVLKTNGHPDSIPSLSAPAVNFGNAVVLDTVSGDMYTFNYATEGWQKAVSENSSEARPYKVYTALISQSGSAAPVAIVLENTFGEVPVWSRFNIGRYQLTFTNPVVTENKAVAFGSLVPGGTAISIYGEYNSSTVYNIVSYDSTASPEDMSTNNLSFFEFRVYE